MRNGFTLIELVVALLIMAVVLAGLTPAARRQRDRMAVVSAREAVVARVARTRREALRSGGAALHVVRDRGLLWIEAEGQPADTLRLEELYEVGLEMAAPEARLPYDALGIGRISSRSLGFVRGGQRAGLAVSAYGRVRRW